MCPDGEHPMRGNTTVVFDLPVDLEELTVHLQQVTLHMTKRRIWNANVVEADQRNGTPKQLSLTIGWEIEDQ